MSQYSCEVESGDSDKKATRRGTKEELQKKLGHQLINLNVVNVEAGF